MGCALVSGKSNECHSLIIPAYRHLGFARFPVDDNAVLGMLHFLGFAQSPCNHSLPSRTVTSVNYLSASSRNFTLQKLQSSMQIFASFIMARNHGARFMEISPEGIPRPNI